MKVPATMQAAVLMGPNRLEIRQVQTPEPGEVDVLIKVQACAVCSTDVLLLEHPLPGQPPYGSFIPGHEYSGTVAALGATVDEFRVGDRVTVEAHLGCLRCRNCRIGNYTACLNYGNRKKGHRANGFTTDGGYAQYVINHINTVHKIPDSTSFEEAALITNLGCVLYGYETVGGYIVGNHVAVIGPGPLGLAAVAAARALGAQRVYLAGTRRSRLQVGAQVGADRIINIHEEDAVEVIRNETGGLGADLAVEASGAEQGIASAIRATRRMGRVLLLSFPHRPVAADLEALALDNKAIYAVRGEGWANVGRAITLLERESVNLKPLVTHTFALSQIEKAFATFTGRIGDAIKVVVQPNR